MNGILKYRIVAFALVVVFGVFNIGIPIVMASCPMAAMMRGNTCGMCADQDDPGTSRVTTEKNTSCCVTTIAAERNTNEFLQAKEKVEGQFSQSVLIAPAHAIFGHQPVSQLPSSISSSPPISVDILILTSSLLI